MTKRFVWRKIGLLLFMLTLAACTDSKTSPSQNVDGDGEAHSESEAESDAETEEEVEAPVVTAFTLTASSHCVQLEATASPSELHAAEGLRQHLGEILTTTIPLCSASGTETRNKIVLGMGGNAKALGVDPTPELLGEQGYQIKTSGQNLVIAGTPGVGTMYGVDRFLEDIAGARWYAPGVSAMPKRTEIPVPEMDRLVKPAFLWRNVYYTWPGADDEFLTHTTYNTGNRGTDNPLGLGYAFDGMAHSYFSFISPEEFFDSHPEYFSEIGGRRIREDTQLCLTNPDVLDIVTERMLKRMAENPGVRQHNFSQMDHYNYCECDKCKALNKKYNTSGGTQFWFVNELAKRTAKVYPDKLIGTLAYMYTEEPPKDLLMHPNAAVWLCHMYPSCDSHPIESCPLNADYKRRAEAWSGLTSHLYIWHYIVDFMHYYAPFPNFDAMSADMKFYRKIGVEGIFLQGMGQEGGGGEWSLLRPYYGAKLLWNPDLDPKAVRRDFLQGYYGAAAAPLEQYIEMLQSKVKTDNIHMHLYTNPAQGYITSDILSQADQYFNEAETLVQNDAELLERVKVARLPLSYARMFPYNGYDMQKGRIHWLSDILPWAQLQDFFKRMESHGFKTLREVAGDRTTMETLYLLYSYGPRITTVESSTLSMDVVHSLGGRALRITHKASGKDITAWNVKEGLYFPFNGGLEDRVGNPFSSFGWVEPAVVSQSAADDITTEQSTMNGFKVQREITLDPAKAAFTVRTTVTNPNDAPAQCRLHEHFEFNLGELRSSWVSFTSRAGETIRHDMAPVIAGMREGVHYYDSAAPDGKWTFCGSKGLQVVETFDKSQLDFAWIYSYPEALNDMETELYLTPKTLAKNESVVFERRYEIQEVATCGSAQKQTAGQASPRRRSTKRLLKK